MAPRVVDNFPREVRELLEEARRAGLAFEDAWERALRLVRPRERSWGSIHTHKLSGERAEGGETPMMFMQRVMRDAYEGR